MGLPVGARTTASIARAGSGEGSPCRRAVRGSRLTPGPTGVRRTRNHPGLEQALGRGCEIHEMHSWGQLGWGENSPTQPQQVNVAEPTVEAARARRRTRRTTPGSMCHCVRGFPWGRWAPVCCTSVASVWLREGARGRGRGRRSGLQRGCREEMAAAPVPKDSTGQAGPLLLSCSPPPWPSTAWELSSRGKHSSGSDPSPGTPPQRGVARWVARSHSSSHLPQS